MFRKELHRRSSTGFLILSGNVIWHASKLLAETKVFRLAVSVMCFYMLKRNALAKKYITERYILL